MIEVFGEPPSRVSPGFEHDSTELVVKQYRSVSFLSYQVNIDRLSKKTVL